MGFIGCIPRFVKAHAGIILTVLEGIGFVGTVILVGKETPKAEEAMVEALVEKNKETAPDGELTDLTLWEKVKASAPEYLPAIVVGTITMGCLVGREVLHATRYSALLTAYGGLFAEYDKYRGEIRKEYGEDADNRALVNARLEVKRLKEEMELLKKQNAPLLYAVETLPGIVFEAKAIDIQEAFMHFNRDLVLGGENTLGELYRFIGIPEKAYAEDEADEYGWNEYENEVDWGINYVDFGLEGVVAKNGQIVHMITMSVPPYRLGGDWGAPGETSVEERICPNYQPRRARQLAESVLEKNQLTMIDHKPIYINNAYLPADIGA